MKTIQSPSCKRGAFCFAASRHSLHLGILYISLLKVEPMKKLKLTSLALVLLLLSHKGDGQCIPTGACPIFGTVTNIGTTVFTNMPTGYVIQINSPGPGTAYFIDLCSTNVGNNIPSGTNDSYITILDSNSSSATSLTILDDGCNNVVSPGFGPSTGTWYAPASGSYFLYLTEYDATGNDPCIADGVNSNYRVEITTTASTVAKISGKVFFDINANNSWDVSEPGAPNQYLSIGTHNSALTETSGNYSCFVTPASYQIIPSLSADFSQLNIIPALITVQADSVGLEYGNQNFAIPVTSGFCSGSLSLTSLELPRPGFTNSARIEYNNIVSATPISQTIRFNYDSNQQFIGCNFPPSITDTISRFIEWDINNLPSTNTWATWITLSTLASVPLGTTINYSAAVSNSSCNSANAISTSEQLLVVASLDPNDKSVSPVGEGVSHVVYPGMSLKYTIRFQNTGNFAAQNVLIVDTLSSYLNPATLKVLSASHNYSVLMEESTVKFLFDSIMLPDSTSNEVASHGFIQFAITPFPQLTNGTVVSNWADIYFDFNAPVRTDTAITTYDVTIDLIDAAITKQISAYPNPSTGSWILKFDEALNGLDYVVTDGIGRIITRKKIQHEQSVLSLPELTSGVYYLKADESVIRLVKQ